MKILSGSGNQPLALSVAERLGQPLTNVTVGRYPDKEVFVEIHESIRGEDVFVVQPTSPPGDENLVELLVILDALRRASAGRITAVIPYYGYARQDRKVIPRTPVTAKLVANLMTVAGAGRILTLDLHAGQIQGFFDIPVDDLLAEPVFARDIRPLIRKQGQVVVAPDVGGVVRARSLASHLRAELAVADKRRDRAGVSEVMHIIGEVAGRDCVIIDDIVDSGGTLCNCARSLMEQKASSVRAYCTHGVLSGEAVTRVESSPLIELVISDSIQPRAEVLSSGKIRVLPVASLIASAISRIYQDGSVSDLLNADLLPFDAYS